MRGGRETPCPQPGEAGGCPQVAGVSCGEVGRPPAHSPEKREAALRWRG